MKWFKGQGDGWQPFRGKQERHWTPIHSHWVVLFCIRNRTRQGIHAQIKTFPRAMPKGTPKGEWLYLTVYPELSPNTDSISFL